MTTPADELRTAAEKLRQLAAAAAEDSGSATWTAHHMSPHDARLRALTHNVLRGGSSGPHGRGSRPHLHPPVADYIAAMAPGVGTALASWLDTEAERLAATTHPGWQETVVTPQALTIARLINRSQS